MTKLSLPVVLSLLAVGFGEERSLRGDRSEYSDVIQVRKLDVFSKLDEALPDVDIDDIVPVFDFDDNGCLPVSGISRTGQQNPGIGLGGEIGSGCRANDFLQTSNTFHRHACEPDVLTGDLCCVHYFALYFEKDQVLRGSGIGGHVNDWEHVAVWTRNGAVTHGSYSAHGDLFTSPISELGGKLQNGHLKFVYHKTATTHAMRFAQDDEVAENEYGTFVTMDVVSWWTMTGDGVSNQDMRNKLNSYNYGSAHLPIKDGTFLNKVNESKPSGYPTFSSASAQPRRTIIV